MARQSHEIMFSGILAKKNNLCAPSECLSSHNNANFIDPQKIRKVLTNCLSTQQRYRDILIYYEDV